LKRNRGEAPLIEFESALKALCDAEVEFGWLGFKPVDSRFAILPTGAPTTQDGIR
jgi:hypothetical protein